MSEAEDVWWIKANQGHSIKVHILDLLHLRNIHLAFLDGQAGIETNQLCCGYPDWCCSAWNVEEGLGYNLYVPFMFTLNLTSLNSLYEATQGLSKMKRNHIHIAQGIAGENVISGMSTRASSTF